MAELNVYAALRGMLPKSPLMVATVASTTGESSIVTLASGDSLTVRGTGTVGDQVFVQGGYIQGPAPSLAELHIDV